MPQPTCVCGGGRAPAMSGAVIPTLQVELCGNHDKPWVVSRAAVNGKGVKTCYKKYAHTSPSVETKSFILIARGNIYQVAD